MVQEEAKTGCERWEKRVHSADGEIFTHKTSVATLLFSVFLPQPSVQSCLSIVLPPDYGHHIIAGHCCGSYIVLSSVFPTAELNQEFCEQNSP